jgi:pilus assembly protein CpaB
MNKNVVIILIGGFFIAVLVAIMVQAMLGGGKKEVTVTEERIQILVAAKDLTVGRIVKDGDFKWQEWPEDSMFVGAVMRDGTQKPIEAAQGKLLRSLSEGQPVHTALVVKDDAGKFLAANIAKGMRAVSISVSKTLLADRMIRPGDNIDLMVTYRVRVNTRSNPEAQSLVNRYATETVLENIRILAIDRNDTAAVDEEVDGKKKKKKSSAKKAILTLEVSPENAEKLLLAQKMGSIGIALRSIGDDTDPASDQATTDVGLSRVMTKLTEMNNVSSSIRIYSGDNMSEVRARNAQEPNNVDFSIEEAPLFEPKIIIDSSALEGLANDQ